MAQSAESPPHTTRRVDVAAAAGLIVLCLAVYANSLDNPLLRDDKTAVVKDPRANDPSRWRDIFTQTYWHGLNDDPIYRPLTTLSFLANHRVTGDRPRGYRIVNVMLHAAVCVTVYVLGIGLIRSRLAAWIAAMLFSVHAVHTEAVTAIVGRADLGVTLLLLAVTILLLGRDGRLRPWRWACLLALSAAALFIKESAYAVLPLVAFVSVWQRWTHDRRTTPPGRRRWITRADLTLVLSVAVVCGAGLCLRYAALGRLSRSAETVPVIDNPLGQAMPTDRFVTAIGLFGKYLGLLAWPHPLCCDYSYRQIPVAHSVLETPVLIGVAWAVGIVAALWLVKRKASTDGWRLAVWCLGFYVITYGLISNALLAIGTIFAERLIYLPSVAWCLAFGALVVGLYRRVGPMPRVAVAAAASAILLVNVFLTVRRNADWQDRVTLWTQAVRVCPNSSRCWSTLAKAYNTTGKHELAVETMQRALGIYDGYWSDHQELGEMWAATGRFDKAAAAHARAFETARGRLRIWPAYRLGQCYMALKDPARAIRAFEAVLHYRPDHLLALNNLAYLQATSEPPHRDLDAAAQHIERALALAPRAPTIVDTAVDVYIARGQRDLAIERVRDALKAADKRHPMYEQLGKRLATLTSTSAPAETQPGPRQPASAPRR